MRSTLGKVSAIMILLTFIIGSILVLNIVKAQNETFNETLINQTQPNTSQIDVLENVTNNETVDNTTSEDFVLSEGESSDILNETVENVTSNITINQTLENVTTNETGIVNETNITNETSNETSQEIITENITLNETVGNVTNETSQEILNETNETIIEPVTLEPIFDVSLEYPDKITRGEVIIVKANIKNLGSLAKNVIINWILPNGFEIISGNQSELCGNLDNNASCYSEISVKIDLSTGLGLNEIKIVVNYEE